MSVCSTFFRFVRSSGNSLPGAYRLTVQGSVRAFNLANSTFFNAGYRKSLNEEEFKALENLYYQLGQAVLITDQYITPEMHIGFSSLCVPFENAVTGACLFPSEFNSWAADDVAFVTVEKSSKNNNQAMYSLTHLGDKFFKAFLIESQALLLNISKEKTKAN